MVNDLKNEFVSLVEVLEIMPKNNKKNRVKYFEYIDDKIDIYMKKKEIVLDEIKRRYCDLYEESSSFDDFELLELKDSIKKKNIFNTAYEKSGLDFYVYEIIHFYKDDFDNLNQDIENAIKIFENVGLRLSWKDFCYNPYVTVYMEAFFQNRDNLPFDDLKKCFDSVYWKCPNIIFYIGLNFKYLYYRYYKKFDRCYLSSGDEEYSSIKKKYFDCYVELMNKKNNSRGNLIQLFFSGSYSIGEYNNEKRDSYRNNISDYCIDNGVIDSFYSCLKEYKFYLDYQFLIDHFKSIYLEKDKYKDCYKKLLKEIKKDEKKLFLKVKKYHFLLKWKKDEKALILLLDINNLLDSLKDKYSLLEVNKVREKISFMNDNVSYYCIFDFLLGYFTYLRTLFEERYPDYSFDEITRAIDDFYDRFISLSYQVINHIMVKEDVNIPQIIADHYRLLNLKVIDSSIASDLDVVMDNVFKLKVIDLMDKLHLSYDDMLFLCNVKKLGIVK